MFEIARRPLELGTSHARKQAAQLCGWDPLSELAPAEISIQTPGSTIEHMFVPMTRAQT